MVKIDPKPWVALVKKTQKTTQKSRFFAFLSFLILSHYDICGMYICKGKVLC